MRLLPLLALLAPLASGCLLGTSNRDETLRLFREFNADLRWGRSELVLPRLAPPLRARFAAELQSLGEDLEFLDEELTGLDVQRGPRGKDHAQCRVELSWSHRRTGLVEKTSVVEHWETINNSWMVTRLVRVRGAPLSLFEEPPAKKGGAPEPRVTPLEQPQGQAELGGQGGGPR